MLKSKFNLYSVGYVAKDKIEDSWDVDVYPIEHVPTVTGDPNEQIVLNNITKNINNESLSINVDKSRIITAKWLPISNSNRVTPPDVCKGETVLVYNFAGTDEYFWNTLYAEPDLRKKEKVTYFFSNKTAINDPDYLNKGYYLTVDTFNKYVKLHTADNDGELTTYDIDIDTANGILSLQDGKGNKLELNSDSDTMTIDLNHKLGINLKKFAVNNGADELISLLAELIQANIDEQHIGNLGIDTSLNSASVSKYKDIKSRLEAFIG